MIISKSESSLILGTVLDNKNYDKLIVHIHLLKALYLFTQVIPCNLTANLWGKYYYPFSINEKPEA